MTATLAAATRRTATGPDELLTAALGYAAAGLAVFPLRPRSKAPLISNDDGGRGFHDATTDPDQIRAWWTDVPTANIGIRPPTDILVVDVDPRAGGDAELSRLIKQHGKLPGTWTTRTGSGGWHLWFTTTNLTEVRAQLGRGIDLKTHSKGYLVAPPSMHPNGTRYRWVTPPGSDPAPAPQWLRHAATPPAPPARPTVTATSTTGSRYTLRCLVARIDRAPEGRRNVIFYGALKDAARDGNLAVFEATLAAAAAAAGLSTREICATVASVRRAAPAGAGR
jgi:hypothetical protein